MSESTNITAQDVEDLAVMGIDAAETVLETTQRSLLELWREVLKSAPAVAAEPIPMLVAHKVVNAWPKMTYQDTAVYHELYHEYISTLIGPLEEIIAADPEALHVHGEEDAERNGKHYLALMVTWHLGFERLESEWVASDPQSHIQLAAMIDARAFAFGATGLAGHLDAIQFRLSDEEFLAAVEAAKEDQ